MRSSLAAAVMLAALPETAPADELRAEITRHVVNPCFAEIIRRETGDPELAADADVLAHMRELEADNVETIVRSLTTSTRSLSPRARLEVYGYATKVCIKMGGGE